jgi:hypothetical protein
LPPASITRTPAGAGVAALTEATLPSVMMIVALSVGASVVSVHAFAFTIATLCAYALVPSRNSAAANVCNFIAALPFPGARQRFELG